MTRPSSRFHEKQHDNIDNKISGTVLFKATATTSASTNACWNFGHVGAPSLGAILSNDVVVAWPGLNMHAAWPDSSQNNKNSSTLSTLVTYSINRNSTREMH